MIPEIKQRIPVGIPMADDRDLIAYPTAGQLQLSTKLLKASLPFQVASRPAKNLGLETDDCPELEGSGLWFFWDEASHRKAIGSNPRRTGYRAVARPSTVLIGIMPRFKKSPVDLTEITQNHSPFKDKSPVKNQAVGNGLILLLVNKSSCTITRYPAPSMRLPPPHVIPPVAQRKYSGTNGPASPHPPINTQDPSFHPSVQSYL